MMKWFYGARAGWIVCICLLISSQVWSADSLVIIDNNKSEWRIVPLSADRQTQFATGELQKYFEQMGNVKPGIEKKLNPAHNILVGLRSDMPEKYLSGLQKKVGYDGY